MNIFKFEPIYMQRVWGGNTLKKVYKRKLFSTSKKIGESWEIVDRNDATSIISNGKNRGKSLRTLILENSKDLMGPSWNPSKRFPVLVKWLDCRERLSLQVHPPEKIAKVLNGEPKTENWYIAHAKKNAGLYIGLKDKITRSTFKKAITDNSVESLCHRVKSKAGDSILVESGRLHAIDGGNLILEIQQNSDTTYRVYDWGRLGINNKPRELHIDKSLKCINFNDVQPTLIKSNKNRETLLAKCQFFRIRKFTLKKNSFQFIKSKNENCNIIHLISGSVKIGVSKLNAGEQALSPFSSSCSIKAIENSTFLITDSFTK
jgi:mannose-6-phosphate isomerase